jgi:hypothetical protein
LAPPRWRCKSLSRRIRSSGRLAEKIDRRAYFVLASCLAHLGRLDEARQELKNGLAVNPNFTIKRFRAAAESDNPVFVAQHVRVAEGMRMAGAPEE